MSAPPQQGGGGQKCVVFWGLLSGMLQGQNADYFTCCFEGSYVGSGEVRGSSKGAIRAYALVTVRAAIGLTVGVLVALNGLYTPQRVGLYTACSLTV